jgi:putative transposase
LNSDRFCDASPRQVYATLLDEGRYVCHWRTMYRVLEEHDEVRERRNQLRHPSYAKPELLATAANQLWSWDITKLRGPEKWTYYYLYVLLDVFSRYVVGWMIAQRESSVLAKELIETSCQRQGIDQDGLVLHSDRGPLGDDTSPNDLEDGGPASGRLGRGEEPFQAACLERQSVLGGAVQDDEIPTGLSRSFWVD